VVNKGKFAHVAGCFDQEVTMITLSLPHGYFLSQPDHQPSSAVSSRRLSMSLVSQSSSSILVSSLSGHVCPVLLATHRRCLRLSARPVAALSTQQNVVLYHDPRKGTKE
jgi:hypothetical protein